MCMCVYAVYIHPRTHAHTWYYVSVAISMILASSFSSGGWQVDSHQLTENENKINRVDSGAGVGTGGGWVSLAARDSQVRKPAPPPCCATEGGGVYAQTGF